MNPQQQQPLLQQPLLLNPGLKTRKAPSGLSCCFWTTVTLASLSALGLSAVLGTTVWSLAQSARFPHKDAFHNSTHTTLPVIPLVNRQQLFDIGVTVWLRPTEEEMGRRRAARESAVSLGEVVPGDGKEREKDDWAVEQEERDLDREETALYSDVAFKGMRLTDKNVQKLINFRVPTAAFCGLNLTHWDLRASFVLIPTSPSPLDYIQKFSHYMPSADKMYRRPLRSWPFPLGSATRKRTMADDLVDSFGIEVPLLIFLGEANETVAVEATSATAGDLTDGDEDDAEVKYEEEEKRKAAKEKEEDESWAMPPYSQPFVITRTQIRVVNDVSLYELKAFNAKHNKLKATSCGQGQRNRPTHHLCDWFPEDSSNSFPPWALPTDFSNVGPCATRISLDLPGVNATQRAYAPTISFNAYGYSEMDAVRVPVNRENITKGENGLWQPLPAGDSCVENKFIDVAWRVSFSGRTPGKLQLSDGLLGLLQTLPAYSANASDHALALAHDASELRNGLAGHLYDPAAHPRRRFFIGFIRTCIDLAIYFLTLSFWWSLTSTVGIPVLPGRSDAVSRLITGPTLDLARGWKDNENWGMMVFLLIFSGGIIVLPYWGKLKALLQLDFGWRTTSVWIPRVSRTPASHWERASERVDGQTSTEIKAGVFATLFILHYFFNPSSLHIMASLHPAPSAADLEKLHGAGSHWKLLLLALSSTTIACAFIAQLVLNARARTFGGRYKVTAYLMMVRQVLWLVNWVPMVVGRMEVREGLSVKSVAWTVGMGWMAWQAVVLPVVPPEGRSEEE